MSGEIGSTTNIKDNRAYTFGKFYYEGETKKQHEYVFEQPREDWWDEGFDRIDISPKDGILSREEICNYRDKQVEREKTKVLNSPSLWSKYPAHMLKIKEYVSKQEALTQEFRKTN